MSYATGGDLSASGLLFLGMQCLGTILGKDGPHEQALKARGEQACGTAYIKREQRVYIYNAEVMPCSSTLSIAHIKNDRCVLTVGARLMLTVGQERHDPMEINVGEKLYAVTFSANGEYLLSGGYNGVRVWRVKDREEIATMKTKAVWSLAVSKDSKWIAAGTLWGDVHVWDANYKQVFAHKEDSASINAVDFSPDSTRLVSASSNNTAAIWDIATLERVHTLRHEDKVIAATYSPQGDRIATTTKDSVLRIYDSKDGRLLVTIETTVTPWHNTGLVWFNNHLLVISDGQIKQVEASTGLAISEWPVPDINVHSCTALPKHGEFIAYSAKRTVTFWDMVTHTQLGLIQRPQDIRSIALSPDDLFIAIGEEGGEIIIENLSRITVSSMYC